MNSYVAIIVKSRHESSDMGAVVVVTVGLFYNHLLIAPVPSSGPVLIGPAQTKWQLRFARRQNLLERPFQQSLSIEPIVVVAKSEYAVLPGERRLRRAHSRVA